MTDADAPLAQPALPPEINAIETLIAGHRSRFPSSSIIVQVDGHKTLSNPGEIEPYYRSLPERERATLRAGAVKILMRHGLM